MAWWEAGPHIKRVLAVKGCRLPFYDQLDSYEREFGLIAAEAMKSHPTLLGIHEADEKTWQAGDRLQRLGYSSVSLVRFENDSAIDPEEYEANDEASNMRGGTNVVRDSEGNFRTVIVVAKQVKTSTLHKEGAYCLKVATLLHEIGHVKDFENRINHNTDLMKVDLLNSEIHAHLHCLRELQRRCLRGSYICLMDALERYVGKGGYKDLVAKGVLATEIAPPANWLEFFDLHAERDQRLLGEDGRAAMARIGNLGTR